MSSRAALFLDRDGVINEDPGYVHRIDEVRFIPGIFELARAAVQAGYRIIVVTNQAGIGRGYFSEAQFQQLTVWMCEQFASAGAPLTAVYHCPHHPEHGIGEFRRDSHDRKPAPGMLLRARDEHGIALEDSLLIGDKPSDTEAALRAGVPIRLLYDPVGKAPDTASATAHITSLHDAISYLTAPCPATLHSI
ncbi:D-glycero-alpha-D-manno-heptose-1,7-bisphosphate 7-phosphatase [Niveibacterium umoris]|uniref:D,D-heptose 1,7-bisphosphate phosphatase n=1 Tax=Niveibacterium umoris TaxID=1193620 RepID=A0A840BN56_9RHOO|nr:HAD family hydrolase [Niveibacterium umoris]MBB4011907.1 D-glycero-D-manno-heptose 1,7-bisphosphate phosphatase [Niveibacterium umoris]